LTDNPDINQLIDHLFRRESGRLVAVLTRIFGPENLDLAEDVVQDALMEALSQWSSKGLPQNQSAWLFRVAKNKALNAVNREKYKRRYSSDVAHYLRSEWTAEPALDHLFSEQEMLDDQLRMMFTCCHPSISRDSQVALTLKTLCGFSIPEIAKAFLTTEENIHKRLVRARQKIRENRIYFELPGGKELEKRLDTVLEAIYLLFNEGYSASGGDTLIRYELCEEAIRLVEIMAEHPGFKNKSQVHALASLMLLNASRFMSRLDEKGNILTMAQQDRSQWNRSLMHRGFDYLEKSACQGEISIYHILAAISAYHCSAPDFDATDWKSILLLYDQLALIDHSPLVLLNRAVAVSMVSGAQKAIEELDRIKNDPFIQSYHLFYTTQAEFYIRLNQFSEAIGPIEKAIRLSRLPSEKELLRRKLDLCAEFISKPV
jgi:RNA polymerase sigma factor (sigma-70 family)